MEKVVACLTVIVMFAAFITWALGWSENTWLQFAVIMLYFKVDQIGRALHK